MTAHPSNFTDLFECVNSVEINEEKIQAPAKEVTEAKDEKAKVTESEETTPEAKDDKVVEAKEEPVEDAKEDTVEEGCGSKIKEMEDEAENEDPRAKNAVLVIMGRAEGVKEDQVHAVLQAMADAQDDDLMMSAINSMRMAAPVEEPEMEVEPEVEPDVEPEVDIDIPDAEEEVEED